MSMPLERANLDFQSFDEASTSVLKMMSQFIGINTLFIAKNDKKTNEILKVKNQEQTLLQEGQRFPFEESFCKLSIDHGHRALTIPDITQDESTEFLRDIHRLSGGGYIGIPIFFNSGENYGTICGIHDEPFDFSQDNVDMFETMSSLLTYVLELERANEQVTQLAAPIIPVAEGVAILSVIGDINEERAEMIIQTAVSKCQDIDALVIDLSAISHIDETVTTHLLNIVNILQLMGVTPVLSGMRPEVAMKAVGMRSDLDGVIIQSNVEKALQHLGFSFEKSH